MKIKKYGPDVKREDFVFLGTFVLNIICQIQSISSQNVGKPQSISNPTISQVPFAVNTFKFKHKLYNVTIPENSVGKTYAKSVLHEDFAGITIVPNVDVKYRISSGDKDKLFKSEERLVGNFAFLAIRTRMSNVVLNREKNEEYVLKVKALINYSHGKNVSSYETETIVHVKVLDRNDLSPLFYPTEYTITISEDTPKHKSILKVMADDADLGINGEIYYSFLVDNDYFAIHPTTGDITLLKHLKYTDNSHFEIVVLANDRGSAIAHNSHKASKAKVYIYVKQANLYAPEIYVKTFSNVNLNASPFICGIVKLSDNDDGLSGEIKILEIIDGNPDGNFQITATDNPYEYYIETSKFANIKQQNIIYNLTLRVEDKGVTPRFSYKSVPIHIIPENKNVPVFTKLIYEVSIPETAPPNMPVIRLKVTDPELGKNALVFLEIVGGNEGGEFRINPDSGMLYTQKPLDAEKKSFYTLTVSAIDQASIGPRKQSSAKVKINIQDMNDNDPVFDSIKTDIDFNENELSGTFVTKVTAKDRDSGENAYISYSIANLNEVPFEIDHFTGIIKTNTQIDYETMQRNYVLVIRASDWGLPYRRQTELELTINIKDINDNRPQFERINCYGKVLRQAPIGTDIFTLSAIDFDNGDYITYRLITGNEDGCFNLDPVAGILSIGCDLMDVVVENRIIKISATDGTHFSDEMSVNIRLVKDNLHDDVAILHGYSSFECRETGAARRLGEILAAAEKNNMKSSIDSITNDLTLTPSRYGENVHTPVFLDFPQVLTLNESLPLGESIAWIKARDRDLGYNGKLVYAISDGDYDSVFRIDPDSGELQIIGYLDREGQDEYFLNITVYDLGQPQKHDSKILPIKILDNNDNAPVLQKSLTSFRVTESAIIGTVIFCLNATDADSGRNKEISYNMKTETTDFAVNQTTGCIILIGVLDREKQDKYELHVIARDSGIPVLSAEALIIVYVDDINDNAPVFGVQEYIFKVREDIPRGTVIASIEAIDLDLGSNGEILFFLKEDLHEEGLFQIDKYTGVIRTQGYLDYENRQVHNLIVSAIDCGTPSLTSEMPIVIEIIDVNENRFAPEFNDYVFSGNIKENQPKGTFVLNVTAKDMDTADHDSKITYLITGGDGLGIFSVNDDGVIRSLSQLDAESKSFYWLTLCAQDYAVVPLTSCVQVYIDVENENDNVPLTEHPVYYVSVTEGSAEEKEILILNGVDDDNDPNQELTYKIISGNPEGYFTINSSTGVLKTTERKLDRENQAEHILEISLSDNGVPKLSSTTRVVVSVMDINDHSPEFDQRFYKVQVPSTASVNESIYQVHAIDNDVGENGLISYTIKSGKGKNKFRIDSETGLIYIAKPLDAEAEYELNIRAEDNGNVKKSQTARLNVVVVSIVKNSPNPPVIVKKSVDNIVDVTENDRPGFLVALIQAVDEDNDLLWYNISSGDDRCEFYIGRDNGNILLSKYLDWETQRFYNLTITVTDGTHVVHTNLYIQVVDVNDNRPQFTKDIYYVNISESIEEESIIMQLHATDKDEDKKIFYHLYATRDPSSLSLFRIDSITGSVIVTQRLDFEINSEHVLIVFAKDQGTPSKRNYAKIVVRVHDHNDHYPEFTSKIIQSKIPESAAIGSKLVHISTIDRDSGKNAELQYSIITGNIGNIFEIDPKLGIITLADNLNINKMQEYILQVKVTDLGQPPLSSQIPVHITITMSENDPPKFYSKSIVLEIFENMPIGSFVAQLEAKSSSSIFFEILDGNESGSFRINPSTGVIVINANIDYETTRYFNLTVSGTNMASATGLQNVIIHILDSNDNIPYFLKNEYAGVILESAEIGTLIQANDTLENGHLVLSASDLDEGINGMLEYHISDELASKYFHIDWTTGSIKLLQSLDYEEINKFTFDVTLNDLGKPKLYSNASALVTIRILNVNDCPPVFKTKELNLTLYKPTFENVFVTQISATDADKDDNIMRYDIVDGNSDDCFVISPISGVITTRNVDRIKSAYILHIRASDGLYSAIMKIFINVETVIDTSFTFQRTMYEFTTIENSTKIVAIGLVNVVGNLLHENVEYRILNPTDKFQVGISSGAIKTTGVMFDREAQDAFKLFMEAKSIFYYNSNRYVRRAVAPVHVSILDINDNCPIFVNLPYYATVSVDDLKGTVILQVKAVDLDSGENGEVRYEMKKGSGELFKIDRKSGELSLKQNVEGHNRNYELLIAAYDSAITPCSTEVPVQIKVIDKSMPIFSKQFYSVNIKEDAEIYSTLSVLIQAESPLRRKLIYTITSGNSEELFEIDYRTGAMFVVNELDYENKQSHELLVRATDCVSGIFAEVVLSIIVSDANDCYPEIENDYYNVTLPEDTPFGTQILKINAFDRDSGANGEFSFYIETINGQNNSDIFYIDILDGVVYLKTALDYENMKFHHVVVYVSDHGTPPLSSKTNIFIEVKDLNDNPPRFIEPSFLSKLSVTAERGQFVVIPKAYDLDFCDNDRLIYKIVDGNELQTYSINENTGIIHLQNMQNLTDKINTLLNVSVTDGIHTTYARVKIILLPENLHSPTFDAAIYKASLKENLPSGYHLITVGATDKDFGMYSSIHYEITTDDMKKYFDIDRKSGEVTSKISFDREVQMHYDVLLKATDGGGKFGFALLKVFVEDTNDNIPYFRVKEYRTTLNSFNLNDTILTVKAWDDDEKENALIKYMINPNQIGISFDDIIEINKYSGEIKLKNTLENVETKLIQFFVRAIDSGDPPLHNDVPVSIQIVNSNISIPVFEKRVLNLQVLESTPPGTVITKLQISGNYSIKYSLIMESLNFYVTENGEVTLLQTLDREHMETHYLYVEAETSTLPILYTYIEIYIHVQDENDNYPKFDSQIYSADIPENVNKVISIIKATATDADAGSNGDVRYYLEDESQSVTNIFDIDIYSGWVTLLSTLDRELQSEYSFNILASDNGQPKHLSKIPVSIKVNDYNDNAPFFKKSDDIEVSENALPGTVLTHFLLIDSDSVKSNIDFYIVSGDNHSQFQIGKNGELFVAKFLDREMIANYNLNIIASDGKFTTYTDVKVQVKDVNDNIPFCLKPRYQLKVNESVPIGSYVTKIEAVDVDLSKNFKLRYYLSGKDSDDFVIGKDTGILKVAKSIDRESKPKYKLLAHAQDGQELLHECVSEILITVIDLNDNIPEFSMNQYIVSIPENVQLQTIVTKVHAIDKDFGLNRKIKYSMSTNSDFFSISSNTGIVKLEKNLDRETIPNFNLTIKAEDQGFPKLYSTTNLIVNVLDINDNPPEFSMKQYSAKISENGTIGSEVCQVFATSKDIGVNAEIQYYILGGNEHHKFNINPKNGIIYTQEELDYEKTKFYFLTVQAIDLGTPPLSNVAYVNISIIDINDNAPKFMQNNFRTNVKEDISVGEKLLQVIATDEDFNQNGVVIYNIERGDRLNQFSIDDTSGSLLIMRPLDRETVAHYSLEVRACDNGLPKLCSYAQVSVDVLDINDNPPVFLHNNYSIVLQENKPLGYVLLTFEISDADNYPNTSPYTFDFRSGNEGGSFRLEQDGSLRTATKFNHKVCDQYVLQIRVFDNGTPPLFSDTWATIKIIEESQYPPIATPLEVTINSFEDEFANAFIGQVYASDQDEYDELVYNLVPTTGETYQTAKLFNITQKSGMIYAINNIDIGLYKLNITISDGKFTTNTIVKINVELISTEMIRHAAIIKFGKISPATFLLSHRKGFIRAIRTIMRCRQKDVIIITLKSSKLRNSDGNNSVKGLHRSQRSVDLNLAVVFAVRKQQIIPTADAYFTREEIREALIRNINIIENETNLVIEDVMPSTCEHHSNSCMHGTCKRFINLYKNNVSTIYTDVISFATPSFSEVNKCLCKSGYDGKSCDEPVNACSSDPCPFQRNCLPSDSAPGYHCICPKGFSGQFCEYKTSKCNNESCESKSLTAVSFSGKSYAHYKINKSIAKHALENQFTCSLQLRTVQQTGTLLYASGRIDYNVLEIVNGAVQYRFDLGSGEGVISVSGVDISDGEWHSVSLERILNSAKLTVDNKHVSQGSAPGINGILNVPSNDVFVGAEVRPHPSIVGYEDIQRGFIGCMANIKIAMEPLPLYISGGSSIAALKRFTNVEFKCDPSNVLVYLGVCGAQPCLNGGICTDIGNSNFKCLCHPRFTGEICEFDLDPCASVPCLFGGRCEYHGTNNYTCICPPHLSGKRCEYGKFCTPNPCQNGGVCEEGDGISHCMCRGYTGPTCEIDVNECENHPCGNGATCINEAGSFRCICPSYLTGASCGDPLYSNSISTKIKNFSIEHISGIIFGIIIVFIIIITAIICVVIKKSSSINNRNRISKDKNKSSYKEDNLNSLTDKDKYSKHSTKISNLEVNQRPISYTPATTDNIFPSSTTFVNNLDILRSYGSAGDELESIPFEYQKVNCINQQVNLNSCNTNGNETDCIPGYKQDWCDQMYLKTFSENKLNNERKKDYGFPMNRLSSGKLIQVAMPNVCHSSPSSNSAEYSTLGNGQYHWDCSDWVRKSHNPLPDITEVPGAEIADSSSFHSNESNESKRKNNCLVFKDVDPTRDMMVLNEDIVPEYIDSELENCIQEFSLPNTNNDSLSRLSSFINSENEDYKINTGKVYLRHPNSYLPPIDTPSETDGESSVNEAFLKRRSDMLKRRHISENSEEIYHFSSAGGVSGSNSNISVRLCEIEDSELEEFLPLEQSHNSE